MEILLESPAIALQAWKLVDEISLKLSKRMVRPNLIETSFWFALESKQAPADIVAELKDMIRDNYNAIADMLGCELTNKIKFFK